MNPVREGAPRALVMMSTAQVGGAERNVVSLLAALPAAGVQATLVTLHRRKDGVLAAEIAAGGIERLDLGARRMLDPAAFGRLRALLRSGRFDVLHTHDQDTHILGGWARRLPPRGRALPLVMTRHVLVEPARDWRENLRARLVLAAARRAGDAIVAVSEAARDEFVRRAGVPPDRVRVIHNGVDTRLFHPLGAPAAARRALGLDPAPTISLVAALRPDKGHDVLLQAVPALREEVPGLRVLVVGTGERDAAIRREAARLDGTVQVLGERGDVPALLAASDVVVLPSRSEALPTVLLEAAACARPVVASRVGGVPEVVVDGETGFLVPPGDATALAARVACLLTDPGLAARMGAAAARRVAEAFSLERQAAATAACYREVLARR